jgi:hypothetical protein
MSPTPATSPSPSPQDLDHTPGTMPEVSASIGWLKCREGQA